MSPPEKAAVCADFQKKVTFFLFTSGAEYGIIYIYGYLFKFNLFFPQGGFCMTRPDRNPASPEKEFPVPLDRKGLPVQPLWLISVLTVLSAAALACGLALSTGTVSAPAPVVQGIAGVLCFTLLFYLFRVLRTLRWVPVLLSLLDVLLVYSTGSAVGAAMLQSLLCSVAFSALLLAVADRSALTKLAFIPLAAYGLSLVLCRDPMLSLAALLPFPAAAALAFGTRASAGRENGPGRVGVICLTSLCLGAASLGIAALLLSRSIGTLSPTHLGAWLDGLRTDLSQQLADLSQQLAEQIPQLTAVTEEQALNTVNSFINILPGTAVMLCNLCAALMQAVLQGCLCRFGYDASVKGRVRLFRMSLVSSCVFLAAGILWLVTSFTDGGSSLAGTVAQNILIILQPGLALAGILRVFRNAARRRGCFPALLLLVLPCLLVYASALPAAYEAVSAVAEAIAARVRPPHDGRDNPFSGD